MIPMEAWVWQGHAGHFCAANQCRFRLATRVGDVLISTVGEYYPVGASRMETIGGGTHDFFETFVFKAGGVMPCGCTEIADLSEVEGVRYATAQEAQAGHLAMCRKWAGIEE